MDLNEWNKAVDEWVERENARAGKVYKPSVGMYPPIQEGLIVSEMGINNKLACADLIRHYADAIGDTNPLWRSEEYAKTTMYGRIIAPPRFLDCIAPPSGMGMGFPDFGVPGMNPLNRGSKYKWFKHVYEGDEFTVEDRYMGVKEVTKKDRPMPRLFLFSGQRKYINQNHEVVAVVEGGAIVVGSGPDLEGPDPAFDGLKRHKYSTEELEEIEKAYDAEKRRGMEVLYWEDVEEGEELPPLVKGPITVMDSVAMFNAIGYTSGFRVTQLLLREQPGWGVVDPETNVTYPVAGIHVSDANARAQRVPFAAGFAAQLEGCLAHLICNWMGDDGFLKSMDCQMRRVFILGDTAWLSGKVVKKYIEDDEYLVDLELRAENQDHALLIPATATVRLLSTEKY